MNTNRFSDTYVISQQRSTRALIKFCEDHGNNVDGLRELRACLRALDRKDMKSAVAAYEGIPLGGMGGFDDWLPPVVFAHETPEYTRAVFEALITQWNLTMQMSAGRHNS